MTSDGEHKQAAEATAPPEDKGQEGQDSGKQPEEPAAASDPKKAKLTEAIQRAQAIAAKLSAQKKETAGKKRPKKDDDDVPYARRESSLEPHEQQPYKRLTRYGVGGEKFDSLGRSAFMNQPGTQMQEFSVPQAMVGLIIGRGGDTLKRIENVTGTKVQFNQSELGHAEPMRRVTVQGPSDGIKQAREMIQKVMDASNDGGTTMPAATPTAPVAAQPSVSTKIPNHKVGLCIGRGGETIKMLQDRSGAKVFIAPDHSVKPGESERHVTIAGDEASIARAKVLLEELVTHGTMAGTYYGSTGAGMPLSLPPGAVNDVCEIPNETAGVVIGKSGETVKWLMQQTGARIQVEQPTVPAAMRKIYLAGTPETIAAAKAMIMEQVAAKMRGDSMASGAQYDGAVGLYDGYGGYGAYDYSAYYAQYGQPAGAGAEYDYSQYTQQMTQQMAQPGQAGEYDYAAYYAYYQQQPPQPQPPPPQQ